MGQCKRSNKINGDFGKIAKEQTMCRSYRPLQHVGNIGLKLTYCKDEKSDRKVTYAVI